MDEKRMSFAELRDWCLKARSDLQQHIAASHIAGTESTESVELDNRSPVDRILNLDCAPRTKLTFAQNCMFLLVQNLTRVPPCPPPVFDEILEHVNCASDELAMTTLLRVEAMCRDTIANPSPIDEVYCGAQRIFADGIADPYQRFQAPEIDRSAMLEIADLGERIAKYVRRQAISESGVNWYVPTFALVEKIERYRNPSMYGPLSIARKIHKCEYGIEGMAALDMLFGYVDRIMFQWNWERICVEDFSKYDWNTANEGAPHRDILMLAYQSPLIPPTVIESIGEAVTAIREVVGAIGPQGHAPTKEPRLVVCLQPPQAIYDGIPYPLTCNCALLLEELRKADGVAISASKFGVRSRDKDCLPKALADLIEAAPGGGTRIPREKLWLS